MDAQSVIGIITALTALVAAVFAGIATIRTGQIHTMVNSQREAMRTFIDLQDSALRTAGVDPPHDPSLAPASVGIEEDNTRP